MYSILEDIGFVEESTFDIQSVLLYSAVCSCGLDMIPLPGNIKTEIISSIIVDVFALAMKLNKPLGVRLLPIPGKEVGDKTNFNHDFICNSKIKNVNKYFYDKSYFPSLASSFRSNNIGVVRPKRPQEATSVGTAKFHFLGQIVFGPANALQKQCKCKVKSM